MPRIVQTGEQTPFEPIPEGDYILLCESAQLMPNSKGGQMVKTQFAIQSTESMTLKDGTQAPLQGRKHWTNFNIAPNSMWAVEDFMVAAGVNFIKVPGATPQQHDYDFNSDDFIGKVVIGHMVQRPYLNKYNENVIGNEVKRWTAYTGQIEMPQQPGPDDGA